MKRPKIKRGGLDLVALWLAAWVTVSAGLWGWLGWPAACLWTGALLTAWAVLVTVAGAAEGETGKTGGRHNGDGASND